MCLLTANETCTYAGDIAFEANVGDGGEVCPMVLAEEDRQARHALELAHLAGRSRAGRSRAGWGRAGGWNDQRGSFQDTHCTDTQPTALFSHLERVVDAARGAVVRVLRQLHRLHGRQLVAIAAGGRGFCLGWIGGWTCSQSISLLIQSVNQSINQPIQSINQSIY